MTGEAISLGRGRRHLLERLELRAVGWLLAGPPGQLRDRLLTGQACLTPLWLAAGEGAWALWLAAGLLAAVVGRWRRGGESAGVLCNFFVLCAPTGHALAAHPAMGVALAALVLLWAGVAGRLLLRLPG